MNLTVKAKAPGVYYRGKMWKPGDEFTLVSRRHFSAKGMRWVEKPEPDEDEVRLRKMELEELRAEAKKHGIAVPALKGAAWGPNRIRKEILRAIDGRAPDLTKVEEEVDDTSEIEDARKELAKLGVRPDLRWSLETLRAQIAKASPKALSQMTRSDVPA